MKKPLHVQIVTCLPPYALVPGIRVRFFHVYYEETALEHVMSLMSPGTLKGF